MHTRSAVRLSAVAMVAVAVWQTAPAAAQSPSPPQNAALRSFETVRSVFQHPRCQNCHIPGNAPLQYDDGKPHAQNVVRGPEGRGFIAMECVTCHGVENRPANYGDRAPPGAPNWHRPPPETKMVFIGLSARALCETIKNKRETGGKDLPAMLAHIRDDKLVGWGWNPGGSRTLPPVSRQDTVAAFKAWMDAGAACPAQ